METKTEVKTDSKTEMFLNKEGLKKFINIFKAIDKLNNEVTITFNKEGLKLVKMDNSNVCLIDLQIKGYWFLEYRITEPRTISFNLEEFLNALKEFKEVLKISLKEDSITLSDTKRVYSVKLIEPETETKTPELQHKVFINLDNLKDFFKTLKVYSGFIDMVNLEVQKDFLITYEQNKTILKEGLNQEDLIKCKYAIDYLIKLNSLKDFNATIGLSNDYPLMITIKEDNLLFKYILAPRIDTD